VLPGWVGSIPLVCMTCSLICAKGSMPDAEETCRGAAAAGFRNLSGA
jgi:hypothetical protein